MRRWGQISEYKSDDWYKDMAKKVYRPEIYAAAAKELIDEGKARAEDFPDFAKESGYRAPQSEFIDNVTFDGSKPNAYLKKLAIGLKGEDKVK
jgi:nitrate/nitrite transport system substrate-binding protein